MTGRARRRLAILALVLGLPAYVFVAVSLVALFDRPGIWVELAVYVGLGVVWVLPLRRLFLGISRPGADAEEGSRRSGDP
jgi:hypothetical protein